MAADVSSLVRLLGRYGREDGGGDAGAGGGGDGERKHRSDLVTRDLLGGCCVIGGGAVGGVAPATGRKKELYTDFNEIMFRDVGFQQHRAAAADGGSIPCSSRPIQDLNMPPLWSSGVPPPIRQTPVDLPGLLRSQPPAAALDLKLRPLPPPPPAEYQSVCTLEKVKSALERAERESRRRQPQRDRPLQPRRAPAASGSPASSSTTTSSAKRRLEWVGLEEEGEGESRSPSKSDAAVAEAEDGAANAVAEMAAAGCPSCLMYVLISRSNPRCPRCSSAVPLPPPPRAAGKKARFDLNAATSAAMAATSPVRTVQFF